MSPSSTLARLRLKWEAGSASAAPQLMQRSGSHSRPAAAHVQCTDTHPPRRQPQPLNLRVQSLPQAQNFSQ
jgi:hypothetical protein